MKQVFNFGGEIVVEDIPVPNCGNNEIKIRNIFSVISSGTESSSIKSAGKGVLGLMHRVRSNPELFQMAVDMAKKQGLSKTLAVVRDQAGGNLTPLGYSTCGMVIEIGKDINDISIGDIVACAGAGYANHAEIIVVPRNLVCKVPANVDPDEAAFSTIGAIALQGIRRAQVQVGESVVVMGLGLLGQIACQILKASGCYVIGLDTVTKRIDVAVENGIDIGFNSDENVVHNVLLATGGLGADAVIIYAGTQSSVPVNQAIQMSRKKGKVVVVGAVGMELNRSPLYEKELDFFISCSYGPGRYDTLYEEKGNDYPISYVRWTENRNMQAFLFLMAQRKINIKKLVEYTFSISEAPEAYKTLNDLEKKPIGVLFKYSVDISTKSALTNSVILKSPFKITGKINIGVIGAGNFTKSFHLPNIKKITNFNLRAIATKTGVSAKNIAHKFGAQYCCTDYHEILNDKDVDMVLIGTRHNLHASIICEAAKAGKHIFVEKPIALNYMECKEIYEALNQSKVNLTIGFNRRFSLLSQQTKRLVEKRKGPLMISCRVNSAAMKKDHWINDAEEGGGAVVGEGCHFFDYINWLIGSEPIKIHAEKISSKDPSIIDNNNIVCTLNYKDGSLASLVYTTIGNESFSKERIEIFFDGVVIVINDFQELMIEGLKSKGFKLHKIDKGQFQLLLEYGKLLNGESTTKDLPTFLDGINATICSLKILDSLKTGQIQRFSYPW